MIHPQLNPGLTVEYHYLLGLLDEAEHEKMQAAVLEDEAAFDRVRDAENDLFDVHARGALPHRYRIPFERRLLATAEGKRKMATAQALALRGKSNAMWKWMATAAGLLAAVGGSVLWHRRGPEPVTPTPPATVAIARATIVLPPGTTRSAQSAPVFTLPSGVAEVEVHVPRPAGAEAEYEVELRTARGEAKWNSGAIRAAAEQKMTGEEKIVVRIPAAALATGPYELAVSSRDSPLAFHYFRIE